MSDQLQRFLFENCAMRGVLVHLDASLQRNLDAHVYPEAVRGLLAEALAAVAILATTVKLEGRISLQLQGAGPLALLLAESTHDRGLRAIAQVKDGAVLPAGSEFADWAKDGIMALSMLPDAGKPYQGVVPLDGQSLAQCLQHYFAQSEQLRTLLRIFFDGERAAALFVQALPDASLEDVERIEALTATITAEELFTLENETVLHRLYHQEDLRLFEPEDLRFQCRCSREKSLSTLRLLEADEIQQMLAEHGQISVNCEFCNAHYAFDRIDIAAWQQATGSEKPH